MYARIEKTPAIVHVHTVIVKAAQDIFSLSENAPLYVPRDKDATMKRTFQQLKTELARAGNPTKAKFVQGYFKTGPGEYGAGDRFLGVTVPQQRAMAKKYADLSLESVQKLLQSQVHEHRLTALIILVSQYQRGSMSERKRIVRVYRASRRRINNWDLVDSSAPYILGPELFGKTITLLTAFARSKHLWDRRIAIITTQHFIRRGRYNETLRLAKLLLHDKHDLIHKAVGWMLREVGERSRVTEEAFLKKYASVMPRTMLRYALEKFSKTRRRYFLQLKKSA